MKSTGRSGDDPPSDREALIDEILEETFPASDVPTWDSVAHSPPPWGKGQRE